MQAEDYLIFNKKNTALNFIVLNFSEEGLSLIWLRRWIIYVSEIISAHLTFL